LSVVTAAEGVIMMLVPRSLQSYATPVKL
jgi:hypothetical protein